MNKFSKSKSKSFFENIFPKNVRNYTSKSNLTNRDLIIINKILPKILAEKSKVLDFACGRAELLSWLKNKNVNIIGIEKSQGMINEAVSLHGQGIKTIISKGTVKDLENIRSNSLDIVLAIGIFQYLSNVDYKKALNNFNRILKPGGFLIATFQNLFFDLFTFNRFTLDFYLNKLLTGKKLGNIKIPKKISRSFEHIIPFSEFPSKKNNIARDNIFVRLSNPMTIREELLEFKFKTDNIYYYDFFGLPPELRKKFPDFSYNIEKKLELKNSEDWRGALMSNAFICKLKKIKII